jgi:hypothetical protein
MRLLFAYLHLLTPIIFFAISGNCQSTKIQSKAIHFKPYTYTDKKGTGIEAFSMLVPIDWEVDGEIEWRFDRASYPISTDFCVYKNNGTQEFNVFPNQYFYWNNSQLSRSLQPIGSMYMGLEVLPPIKGTVETLKQAIQYRFRKSEMNLEIVNEEHLPSLPSLLGEEAESMPGLEGFSDGAKIVIEYELDGKNIEEEFYGVVKLYQFLSANSITSMWSVEHIYSYTAEKGKLDEARKIGETIRLSIKNNPLWLSKVSQVVEYLQHNQMQQIRNAGEVSKIISQTNNEISDMIMDSYNKRQETMDHIHENYSDYIRGVEQYRDPFDNKPVELPSGYQYHWRNRLGETVISNNPDDNPNKYSNSDWQAF